MDPNETLKEIRYLIGCYHADDTWLNGEGEERLIELVDALDGWLSKGGFLPSDWNRRLNML